MSDILPFLSAFVTEENEVEKTDMTAMEDVNGTDVVVEPMAHFSATFTTPEVRELVIIIDGVLSLVQVAIQKVGQSLNFAARSDMHHQAESSGADRF